MHSLVAVCYRSSATGRISRAAGQQGRKTAGQEGRRVAGQEGSRAGRQQGRRAAGQEASRAGGVTDLLRLQLA